MSGVKGGKTRRLQAVAAGVPELEGGPYAEPDPEPAPSGPPETREVVIAAVAFSSLVRVVDGGLSDADIGADLVHEAFRGGRAKILGLSGPGVLAASRLTERSVGGEAATVVRDDTDVLMPQTHDELLAILRRIAWRPLPPLTRDRQR